MNSEQLSQTSEPSSPLEPPTVSSVGIIGAGKVGTVLARHALQAGYQVTIAGSKAPADIDLIISVLAPGAQAATTHTALQADVVILALPLSRFIELPVEPLRNKLVIDAMNYWLESDGQSEAFGGDGASTSERVQEHFQGALVVKAFNHLGYHDIDEMAAEAGSPSRVAIALAGDDEAALKRAGELVDSMGFDPLPIGPLASGVAFQPFTEAFGATLPKDELKQLVERFPESERGRLVRAALHL